MKLDKLFILTVPFFLLITLLGCSKEEDAFTTLPEEGQPLTLKVTSDKYVSANVVETRIAEEGYTTQFTSGDEIGILQITPPSGKDGEAIYKNYRFILDDECNWTGVPLPHKQGDEYIVYYPYTPVENQAALEAYIASFEPRPNQSAYEDYTKSDLMTGEGLVSGTTLTVNLKHLMTLVVVEFPLGKCATTKDGKVKYHPATTVLGPPAFSWEDGKIPYQTSDDRVLRYIVKPGMDFSLKGSYPYYIGTRKFDITATASDAVAQHYLAYTLDEGIELPGSRDVQVGDYYMSDGTVLPGDASSVPEGCVGIVFQTATERISADEIAQGWTHGYVMALTDAGKDLKWGNRQNEGEAEGSPFGNRATTLKGMYEDIEGYIKTNYMMNTYLTESSTLSDAYGTFLAVKQYGATTETAAYKVQDGVNASNWYLPSTGQWWDILENLGGSKSLPALRINEEVDLTKGSYGFQLENDPAITNLNTYLQKASGSSFEKSKYYWSSSEHNRLNSSKIAYTHSITFSSDTSISSTATTKDSNSNRRVRCVLSF